jgi:hypothetical protein
MASNPAPSPAWASLHMLDTRFQTGAFSDRAGGKEAEAAQAVVHNAGACGGEIERKGGWNADEMMAAGEHLFAEHPAFRAEYIGGLHRVGEGRQFHGLVEKLDTDEPAAAREAQLIDALPMIKGRWEGALEVSAIVSMALVSAPLVKTKFTSKACAERKRLPRLTAFETPSMPMAK